MSPGESPHSSSNFFMRGVPKGRLNDPAEAPGKTISAVPSGLKDHLNGVPNLERLGYFQAIPPGFDLEILVALGEDACAPGHSSTPRCLSGPRTGDRASRLGKGWFIQKAMRTTCVRGRPGPGRTG